MYLKRIMLFIIIATTLGLSARRPGATFLLIPPTARTTGMAYAFTAIADDASANYYNAAGLAFLNSPALTVSYNKYLPGLRSADMHYMYLGAAYPSGMKAWGIDLIYFSPGTIEVIDIYGNYIGDLIVWRIAPKINYARELTKNLSCSVGWKFIYQKYGIWSWIWPPPYNPPFEGNTGFSWAFDLNAIYKLPFNISIGSVLQNIGPNIRYDEFGTSDPLPLEFHLGIAYTFEYYDNFEIAVSAEISKILVGMFANEDNSFTENLKYELKEAWKGIGTEFSFSELLSLRFGYFYDYEGQRKGLTFGGGIQFKGLSFDIGIDENIYDFETTNRKFSLSYVF